MSIACLKICSLIWPSRRSHRWEAFVLRRVKIVSGTCLQRKLQYSVSAMKGPRKQFYTNVGRSRPQYGHDLSQNLQPDAAF